MTVYFVVSFRCMTISDKGEGVKNDIAYIISNMKLTYFCGRLEALRLFIMCARPQQLSAPPCSSRLYIEKVRSLEQTVNMFMSKTGNIQKHRTFKL